MSRIEEKLKKLGLVLGSTLPPVGNYLGSKQNGSLLFVSGRKSELKGRVGEQVNEEEAKLAARDTVLTILSIVRQDIDDLDRIEGVVKVQGF